MIAPMLEPGRRRSVKTPVRTVLSLSVAVGLLMAGPAGAQVFDVPPPRQDAPSRQVTGASQPPAPTGTPRLAVPRASFSKALLYSAQLNFYTHVMRVTLQEHTRRELRAGPFWRDYVRSVRMPTAWHDHDPWRANYIGHAIHGGAATRIWMDLREPRSTSVVQYLRALGRAAIFTAIFSEQFEFGPMSEASIGNVGLRRGRIGWVDHVWTPIGGVLWTMAEDAIDRYAIVRIERHVSAGVAKAARMAMNPSRILANVSQNRVPWDRIDRPLTGR
jgi:hypothetical protein